MGKKNRKKHRSPDLALRSKKVPPDEYHRVGPVEFARFGKNLVAHSLLTQEQIDEIQARAVENYPNVVREIDETIYKIVELTKTLSPKTLLNRAYLQLLLEHLPNKNVETEDQVNAMRMLEYLQCVIVSQNCFVDEEEVSDSDWDELKSLIENLYRNINLWYPVCRRAINKLSEDFDEDIEEFRFQAQLHWCNVRGKRYTALQIKYFSYLLSPHNDVFKRLFGIDVDDFLGELDKIIKSLSQGPFIAFNELLDFRDDSMEKMEEKLSGLTDSDYMKSPPDLMAEVVQENNWDCRINDILGRCFRCDLFDLSLITDLPNILLNELSWAVGENKSFFAEGDFCGWPLRVMPISEKPFIKIDEHFYCFDLHSVFDNLYRILQRIILRLEPSYREEWKTKQTQTSETLPLDLFKQLMPDAELFHSVFYEKKGCRKEVDGLVLSEDHLFVVEVKGGAFTRFSPATDFDSYLDSLKALVLTPAEQGRRFLKFLDDQKNVDLFDSKGDKLGELNADEWTHRTVCCVTLDPFTHLAAQVQRLKSIGVDVGEEPIWQISIDDLLVYVDMFDNPLVFLHYVEQRNIAFGCKELQLNDELDHLGLYLEFNAYSKYVGEMMCGMNHAAFDGFTSEIDKYYDERIINPEVVFTQRQEMPDIFKQIISFASVNNVPHRRLLVSTLLNCAGDTRNKIKSEIEHVLMRQEKNMRVITLSLSNINMILICWQEGVVSYDESFARDQPYIAMIAAKQEEYLSVELFFNKERDLIGMHVMPIKKSDIPSERIQHYEQEAEDFRNYRLGKVKSINGKIGRNANCPCGSGLKFKKCCGKK